MARPAFDPVRAISRDLARGLVWATDTADELLPPLDALANVSSAFSSFRPLKSSYEGSLLTAAAGVVSAFLDQSGNGRDLAQATAGSRPTLEALGDGTPVLGFDGTRFMAGANLATLIQNNNGLIACSFIATAVNRGGVAQNGRQVVGDAAEGGNIVLKNSVTSPRGLTGVQFDGAYRTTPGTYVPLDTPLVGVFRKDGAAIYSRVNLLGEQSAACGNLSALGFAIYLGGNGANRFVGRILELVTLSASPSEAAIEALIDNMMRAAGSPFPPDMSGYPDAGSTGSSGALTPVTGDIVLSTPGQTYENMQVTGSITVTASNVTVRNCKVLGTNFSGIEVSTGAGNVLISHCEVDCQNLTANGIYLEPGTADCIVEFCHVHDMENGINLLGDRHTIRDNYVHSFNLAAGDPHYDGIEMNGSLTATLVTHNTVLNDNLSQTSAIMINNSFGAVDGLTVSDNYVAGGGFVIYCDGQFSGVNLITNVTISDNVMGPGGNDYFGINSSSPTLSGNIRVESGFAAF